ncbi:MAG: type II toxin-antitoxin system Phd/YefM family antitoxin [Inquilinaceae bacterium]
MDDIRYAPETKIGVTEFKAKCLALIDLVASGKIDRLVLTKHDRPVACVSSMGDAPADLWGAMKGTIRTPAATDLTQPTGERWDVDD